MLQMVRDIFIFIAMVLLTSCEMFDAKGFVVPTSDAVNTRFEKSMSLHGNNAVATIDADESYVVYVCADSHVKGTYNNLREFSTRLRNDELAVFGIMLGDCANPRNTMPNYIEGIKFVDGTQAVDKPIFSLIGNHDLYFNGWNDFYKYLGASVYWFEVEYAEGRDLFIALDSASGTLGNRQIKWLKELLAAERDKYRHCVVLTHTNLFYTDNSQQGSGNMALEETALLTQLFSRYSVTLCLQGHDHYREDLVLNGVRYTTVGSICDEVESPEYLVIRMTNSGVEYTWEYISR